jgi:hypothetical protein
MEAPEDPGLHIRKHHRVVAAALGTKDEIDDPGRPIEHPIIHSMEMLEIP